MYRNISVVTLGADLGFLFVPRERGGVFSGSEGAGGALNSSVTREGIIHPKVPSLYCVTNFCVEDRDSENNSENNSEMPANRMLKA